MQKIYKTAILTTVVNWDLYRKSSQYFPQGIQKYVIDGKDGMFGIESLYFMMDKFKKIDVDWLIMADEDVLFLDPQSIYDVIDHMNEKEVIVSGVRDGGDIPIRAYSPYTINTFFSIINLKKLKVIWNKNEIKKNQYINEGEFDEDLSGFRENFDASSLFEPYYCFYFWLRRKGEKILFLNADTPLKDKITTLVYTPTNQKLLYHTWYARFYGQNKKHTDRIDEIFDLLTYNVFCYEKPIVWKDNFFFLKRRFRKFKRRVIMKINKIKDK